MNCSDYLPTWNRIPVSCNKTALKVLHVLIVQGDLVLSIKDDCNWTIVSIMYKMQIKSVLFSSTETCVTCNETC